MVFETSELRASKFYTHKDGMRLYLIDETSGKRAILVKLASQDNGISFWDVFCIYIANHTIYFKK